MAFNGSKHFPPGEMVGVFQLLGMGFGADTNANTSYQRTLFMLDLPDTSDKVVRESLQLFRDDADGLLLLQSEIDRERGVILSEKRDRDNVDYREFTASWDFYFPDSLISHRQPIGLESVIRNAQQDRFLAYYRKWYTPDRMTLIAVGDVKPDDFAKLIQEYFGPIEPRTQVPSPDLGKFGSPGFEAAFHREAEAPAVSIELATISPFDLGPDRVARRAQELQLDAANLILSRRFQRIAREPNSPIIEAGADSDNDFDAFEISTVAATCQPGQWRPALNTIEQELRRALEYGFSDAEVNEVRATLQNALEQQAQVARDCRRDCAIARRQRGVHQPRAGPDAGEAGAGRAHAGAMPRRAQAGVEPLRPPAFCHGQPRFGRRHPDADRRLQPERGRRGGQAGGDERHGLRLLEHRHARRDCRAT
jgi:zinc protease